MQSRMRNAKSFPGSQHGLFNYVYGSSTCVMAYRSLPGFAWALSRGLQCTSWYKIGTWSTFLVSQQSARSRGSSFPLGLHPVGHTLNTSPGGCPGGFQRRCPNHFNWLLSTWSSSASKVEPLLWMLCQSVCQYHALIFPHWSTKPQNSWIPPSGVGALHPPRVEKLPSSGQEPSPRTCGSDLRSSCFTML